MTDTGVITAVLDRLRAYLNTGETPPGSNHNFITEWYNTNVDHIGDGPWCEMTNTWCMWTGGARSLKNARAYTVFAAMDAQAGLNGSSWHWGTSGMRAGDEVYYDWDQNKTSVSYIDHTGTVEKINGDGTFYVLEGNHLDKLLRVRRDSKFVVGYVRFAWSKLTVDGSKPSPIVVHVPTPVKIDKNLVLRVQSLLKVSVDGAWGPRTDIRALRMRNAARNKLGWPKSIAVGFDIEDVQHVIGTSVDGVWGPKSQAALKLWVKQFQAVAHVSIDGSWGPQTDNAFLAIRVRNHMV